LPSLLRLPRLFGTNQTGHVPYHFKLELLQLVLNTAARRDVAVQCRSLLNRGGQASYAAHQLGYRLRRVAVRPVCRAHGCHCHEKVGCGQSSGD
jgi:hypothetical protein